MSSAPLPEEESQDAAEEFQPPRVAAPMAATFCRQHFAALERVEGCISLQGTGS
ncbi:TPA: hypothetical protein ACH3X2_012588 [Trebouxia sp. C0005]